MTFSSYLLALILLKSEIRKHSPVNTFIVKIAEVINLPFGHNGFDVICVSHGEAEKQWLCHEGWQDRFMFSTARVDFKTVFIDNALRMADYHSYTGSQPESAFPG